MVMSEIALPRFASVEVVLIMSEPPEAFTLTVRPTERPLPAAFEGVMVRVVLSSVVGVPESTHVLLRERPAGSPVLVHEVGALPAFIVGESKLIATFCTSQRVLETKYVVSSQVWLPETETGETWLVLLPPLPNCPEMSRPQHLASLLSRMAHV